MLKRIRSLCVCVRTRAVVSVFVRVCTHARGCMRVALFVLILNDAGNFKCAS